MDEGAAARIVVVSVVSVARVPRSVGDARGSLGSLRSLSRPWSGFQFSWVFRKSMLKTLSADSDVRRSYLYYLTDLRLNLYLCFTFA